MPNSASLSLTASVLTLSSVALQVGCAPAQGPKDVYRNYLQAIRAEDEDTEGAKRLWTSRARRGPELLDLTVGTWIEQRRFDRAVTARFGDALADLRCPDCTDEALGRTMARLDESVVTYDGDQARLVIRWEPGDGTVEQPVFGFSGNPIRFRRIGRAWMLDADEVSGATIDAALDDPRSWASMFTSLVGFLRRVTAQIESGGLATPADVRRALEEHTK